MSKNNKKIKDGSVKTFGFRSGKSYKMIPAILYYLFAAMIVVMSIMGELTHYKFEMQDYVLFVFKYVFITVLLFSPLIFLSDYNYVYKIPLFGRKDKMKSLLGMIIVFMICYFMWNIQIYATSDTYKTSVAKYTKQLEQEAKKRAKKMENETQKSTNKKGQTVFSHINKDGDTVEEVVDDAKKSVTTIIYNKKDGKVKSKKVVKMTKKEFDDYIKKANSNNKKSKDNNLDNKETKTNKVSKNNDNNNSVESVTSKSENKTKKTDFNDDDGWSEEK